MCGLSLIVVRRGYSSLCCTGTSLWWLLLWWSMGSRSQDWWALEHQLSSCGTQAQLLLSKWNPAGPGIEPLSPVLAGRLPSTGPRGKSPQTNSLKEDYVLAFSCLSHLLFSQLEPDFSSHCSIGIIWNKVTIYHDHYRATYGLCNTKISGCLLIFLFSVFSKAPCQPCQLHLNAWVFLGYLLISQSLVNCVCNLSYSVPISSE